MVMDVAPCKWKSVEREWVFRNISEAKVLHSLLIHKSARRAVDTFHVARQMSNPWTETIKCFPIQITFPVSHHYFRYRSNNYVLSCSQRSRDRPAGGLISICFAFGRELEGTRTDFVRIIFAFLSLHAWICCLNGPIIIETARQIIIIAEVKWWGILPVGSSFNNYL